MNGVCETLIYSDAIESLLAECREKESRRHRSVAIRAP